MFIKEKFRRLQIYINIVSSNYDNVSDCSQSNSFYILKMTRLFSDPPKVKDKIPLRLIWALGFTEKLDCPVDANPPVTEFVWTKNGLVIMFENSPLQQLANGSLLVEQVTQSDAGNYRCTAKSSVGYDDSEIMQVEVKGKIYCSKYDKRQGYNLI